MTIINHLYFLLSQLTNYKKNAASYAYRGFITSHMTVKLMKCCTAYSQHNNCRQLSI